MAKREEEFNAPTKNNNYIGTAMTMTVMSERDKIELTGQDKNGVAYPGEILSTSLMKGDVRSIPVEKEPVEKEKNKNKNEKGIGE